LIRLAFVVLLLAGCAAGPDYRKPDAASSDTFRETPGPWREAQPRDEIARGRWWEMFGDPQLNALIEKIDVSNQTLAAAEAQFRQAQAGINVARAPLFPSVDGNVSVNRSRSPSGTIGGTTAGRTITTRSASVSASWELDLWGRIRRETEASRADLLATEQARRGVALTLVSAIVTGYVNLLDLDRQLKISEDTLKVRQASVKVFRQRFEGGTISDFEMQQVLAEYEIAVAAIPQAERLIAAQENGLSFLLGRNPGPIARASALEALGRPLVPAGLPAALLERRPDVQAAEQQLIAANARIGVARALYYPNISLTSSAGSASADLDNLFSGPARTWSFVGQLLGPIFAGGAIAAANRQAEARKAQALAAYEGSIQNAFRDVEDALAAVITTREVQAASERRTASLRRARCITRTSR
jgi:multidrug efflux system outer membrane protein